MDIKNKETEQALRAFRVLARAYNSVAEHSYLSSKSVGFKPNEFAILELLYHKGPQQPKDISEKLLLVGGGVTYVLNKLEDAGLIIRTMLKSDRRVILTTLTEKGKQVMDEVFPKHAEKITAAMSGLNEEEKAMMIQLLKQLGIAAEKNLGK